MKRLSYLKAVIVTIVNSYFFKFTKVHLVLDKRKIQIETKTEVYLLPFDVIFHCEETIGECVSSLL